MKQRDQSLMEFAVDLYKQTGSGHRVAASLGIGPKAAYRLLAGAGVIASKAETSRRLAKLQGQDLIAVVEAYKSGEPMKEIQRKFNCGQIAIYTAVREAGEKRRPRGQQPRRFSQAQRDEIVMLRTEKNWPQAAIAARVGCHQTLVSRVLRVAGVAAVQHAKGPAHGSGKGGRSVSGEGYALIRWDGAAWTASMVNSIGYIPEHRLVMAKALSRALNSNETVHHIDGNRLNNNIKNLQLRQGKHGKNSVFVCACCGSNNILAKELS